MKSIQSLLPMIACGISTALYGATPSAHNIDLSPAALRQSIEDVRYQFAPAASDTVRADNDANAFSARFTGSRTSIAVSANQQLTLTLRSYGWGGALHAAGPVMHVVSSGKRLERTYGSGLSEWFLNTPQGLEQGFVVANRASHSADPLRLLLAATGGWSLETVADRVRLKNNDLTLEYAGLKAWDATGAVLGSHLTVSGGNIEIRIDDAHAVYPITIDPVIINLTLQQELGATGGAEGDQFGYAVAVSGDGTTALVGAPTRNNYVGAAFVFTRSGATWTQQQELAALDAATNDQFGWSVALSSDGNTALIGAVTKNNMKGAAYVFTRSGATWTQMPALTALDGAPQDFFGYSVTLSSDGNTALIGAPIKRGVQITQFARGAAYVFTRPGSDWSQQQKLVTSDAENNDQLGYSVALSGDGNIAIVGVPNRTFNQGIACVFTRSGTTWTPQQELAASDAAMFDQFGRTVALSSDGSTLLTGAVNKAYVFLLYGTTYTPQQELTSSNNFGYSVSLSNNGNTALISAPDDNAGAAYIFDRTNASWNQRQKMIPSDGVGGDQFGWSAALSGDGSTAVAGAPGRNNGTGAAYVFAADTIAPTGTSVQSPLPNASGWNTTDVLITWNWADNPGGSGIDPAQCTTSSASSGEGTLQITATCNDVAGNIGSAFHTAKVDKTHPTVTPSATKADGTSFTAGGWSNQTVTVSFACSDSASGIATCPAAQVFPASAASASGTAFDVAGNSTFATFGPIQIEKIPPTISAAVTSLPNANGWYKANVAVRFTCSDSDSGIPKGTCPVDQNLSAEGTAVTSTPATVTDAAGNISAPSNTVTVQIDKTSPSVVYTGNLGTYEVDQTVAITCSAADALSGVATTSCSNVNGAAYAIGVGSHSYSANASDRAGNTGSGSTSFKVVVTFNGVTNLVYRWATKSNIADNLVITLQGAQQAFASGNTNSGDKQLNSFINQVSSQSGKSLAPDKANLLIQYAQALMR